MQCSCSKLLAVRPWVLVCWNSTTWRRERVHVIGVCSALMGSGSVDETTRMESLSCHDQNHHWSQLSCLQSFFLSDRSCKGIPYESIVIVRLLVSHSINHVYATRDEIGTCFMLGAHHRSWSSTRCHTLWEKPHKLHQVYPWTMHQICLTVCFFSKGSSELYCWHVSLCDLTFQSLRLRSQSIVMNESLSSVMENLEVKSSTSLGW